MAWEGDSEGNGLNGLEDCVREGTFSALATHYVGLVGFAWRI